MKFITRIVITALVLIGVAHIVPGIVVSNIYTALIAALVLGFLNSIMRPLLLIFTLPITILSLGLFIFVINACLFGAAAFFIDGFTVQGFLPALVGSLITSAASTVLQKLLT